MRIPEKNPGEFQESSKWVPREFQQNSKSIPREFQESSKRIPWEFQENSKIVQLIELFSILVLANFYLLFKKEFQEHSKRIARGFQENSKGIPREVQESSKRIPREFCRRLQLIVFFSILVLANFHWQDSSTMEINRNCNIQRFYHGQRCHPTNNGCHFNHFLSH